MNIDQIKIFLSLVETMNFSYTADKLYISQSVVSKNIRMLEEEFDCRLFIRGKGKPFIELTEDGEEFLQFSKRIYRDYSDYMAKTTGKVEDRKKRLVIASELAPSVYGITGAVEAFEALHPEADIILRIRSSEVISNERNRRVAQVFIAFTDDFKTAEYRSTPLIQEEVVLVLPPDHRLANYAHPVDLTMIKGEPFASHERSLIKPIFQASEALDLAPVIKYDTCNTEAVLSLVSEKKACGIVASERAYNWNGPPIVIKHMNKPSMPFLSSYIKKNEAMDLANEFYDFVGPWLKHNITLKNARVV